MDLVSEGFVWFCFDFDGHYFLIGAHHPLDQVFEYSFLFFDQVSLPKMRPMK